MLKGGVGSTKTQIKSACFCLRKLVQHLNRNHRDVLTQDLSDLCVHTLLRGRITESEYSEIIRDLIKWKNNDMVAVIKKSNIKKIFDYSVYAINCLTNNPVTTAGSPIKPLGHIYGK